MTPDQNRWHTWERKQRPYRRVLAGLLVCFAAVFIAFPLLAVVLV